MPNPVKAARKAGRQNLKDLKQNIRAEKITKKFEAKADKIGMKTRAAGTTAKSAAEAKAGVSSYTPTKMESKSAPQIPSTAAKAEIKKSTVNVGSMVPKAAASKKSSGKKSSGKSSGKSSSKTSGISPYLTGENLPAREKRKFIFTDAAAEKEKKRLAEANAYLKKEQAQREANQKAEQEQQNNRETRRVFRGPVTVNYRKKGGSAAKYNMGGTMKSSYMKGGSAKSKKK